jgi:CRISPR-associated endonuclease Cas1
MLNDFNTENVIDNGTLFIHAYNVKIRVSDNQLLIDFRNPIKGEKARITSFRLNRATSGLKRLIISGDDGYISLNALRWLAEIKAAIMQIGFDNELYLASVPPGSDYPALRRYQVLASITPLGAEIVRKLLTIKMQGQIDVMKAIEADQSQLTASISALQNCESPSEMMSYEGQASLAYWTAWKNIELIFAKKDQKILPEHWRCFRKRVSDFGPRPRRATNPANAMLNYLYAILKGETTTALQSIGLDPGIGFLHSDNICTPNLSLDVMEAVRPLADAWYLSFLKKRIFTKNEFFEMQDGSVRMAGNLRQELSAFGPIAFSFVAPWAEYVVQTLEKEFTGKSLMGTPLTQGNRKNGRKPYRLREHKLSIKPNTENRCIQCGKSAPGDNLYCPDCYQDRQAELRPTFISAGVNHLKGLREKGISIAHGGEAGRKRGETQKERRRDRIGWERANPGLLEIEKVRFIHEIQPLLQTFSVREIGKACSCSLRYASLIRSGKNIPHPIFYQDLEKLILDKPYYDPEESDV